MTHRSRIRGALLLAVFLVLAFGLRLAIPFPIAVAGAVLGTGLLWQPLTRFVEALISPSPTRTQPGLEDLYRLSAESFEGLIAGVFRSLGFTVDEMDYRGDTYLADFILQHETRGEIVVAITRQHAPHDDVEATLLDSLVQAVRRFNASRGILVTTGRIPREVEQTAAQEAELIELIDGSLLQRLASHVAGQRD